MNTLDIIVLVIICMAIVFGLWKGLVRQIFSLVGVIAGYVLAGKYYEAFSRFIPSENSGVNKIISFMVIFILCIITSLTAAWLIGRLLKSAELNWINRIGGGILGFVKGALIVTIIAVILLAFLPAESRLLNGSVTFPYLISFSKVLSSYIPQNMKDEYRGKIEKFTTYKPLEKLH